MDEVCGVWTGFPRPGLCCGGCQCFEIGQLSQMEAFKKASIKKISFLVRHCTVECMAQQFGAGQDWIELFQKYT